MSKRPRDDPYDNGQGQPKVGNVESLKAAQPPERSERSARPASDPRTSSGMKGPAIQPVGVPPRADTCSGCNRQGHDVDDCQMRNHPDFNESGAPWAYTTIGRE